MRNKIRISVISEILSNIFLYRWQGDYNGQIQKWFPVNFTEETVVKEKASEVTILLFIKY